MALNKYFIFLPSLLLSTIGFAQQEGEGKLSDSIFSIGKIEIIQDPRIDSLLQKHIEINESKPTIGGYRVQIYIASGASSRKKSYEAQALFLTKYPDVEAYVIHQVPNFKVRAGDFRTKLDAYGFLKVVKKDYPGAFIVKDEINLPKL